MELGPDGVKLYPKSGANLLVTAVDGSLDLTYLLAAGQLDKVEVTVGGTVLTVKPEGILLGGDSHGGLVYWPDLKERLDKVLAFERALNTVLGGTPIPEPGNGSPSALQTALKAALAGSPLPTDFEGLESSVVKQ